MSRLQISSLVILLVLLSGNAVADGNKFLEHCQSFLEIERGQIAKNPVGAGHCIGYIQGFWHLSSLYGLNRQKPFWCLPDGVSGKQLISVVVKYLQDHPEKLHQSQDLLVLTALADAFPCND